MTNRESQALHATIANSGFRASGSMLTFDGAWGSLFEIEATLGEHPSVVETAVVGRADVDGSVRPAAWVVLKRGVADAAALEAELADHCASRLEPSKAPRWFHFVSALPKTATGILLRGKLRGEDA